MRVMNLFNGLNDPLHPRVVDALTRKCRICAVKPEARCVYPDSGQPLADRVVHLDRTEAVS